MRQLNNIPGLLTGQEDENKTNFTINDIRLFVPPTAISIHKENLEYSYKTLRSKVSTKILSGNGVYHAQISLVFPPDSLIQLHRLICQVRNSPFVYLESKFIEDSLPILKQGGHKGLHFTLIGLSINSHPSSPLSFVVELDLRYFNHKAYGNEIAYKKQFHFERLNTDGNKTTFTHRIFPNYNRSQNFKLNKIDLFSTKVRKFDTKRAIDKVKNILSTTGETFPSRYGTAQASPKDSNAYKAYSNYLQLKSLNESFGIEIIPGANGKPNKVTVNVNENLYNKFQGIGSKLKGKVLGLHEFDFEDLKSDTIEFRQNLTHAMLSRQINTSFIFKAFKVLKFEGDFLKRYRESLNEGLEGVPFKEKQRIKGEREKELLKLFDDAQAKPEQDPRSFETIRTRFFNSFPDLEVEFKYESAKEIGKETDVRYYEREKGNYNEKYHPVVTKPSYVFRDDIIEAKTLGNKTEEMAVFSPIEGEIKINDSRNNKSIIIRNDDEEIIIEGVKVYDKLFKFYEENNDVYKGDVIGFIGQEGRLLLRNYSSKFIEDLKGAKKSNIEGNNDFNNFKAHNPTIYGKITANDRDTIQALKTLLEEEGYASYSGRIGIENVLEKATNIVFGHNQKKEAIELVTGKKVIAEAADENNYFFNNLGSEITSVSCSLRHIVASIPLLGYEYPTHQYLGSVEPMYQFNFVGANHNDGLNQKLKEVEGIRGHTAYMAKNFPQIPDAGNIHVDTFITRLVGSYKETDVSMRPRSAGPSKILQPRFIISSLNTFTIEGSPGTTGLNLRFAESKPFYEEEMRPVQSTKLNDQYLQEYARFVNRNSDVYATVGEDNEIKEVFRSEPIPRAKKPPYEFLKWKTKYFSAYKWYRFRKYSLRKKPLESLNINQEEDKRAYQLCLLLDDVQDFLNFYGNQKLPKKSYSISIFSTLDRKGNVGSRKTFSNHFANCAADIKVRGLNAFELCAIIQGLADYGVIQDPTGSSRAESNRESFLGLGVYGINTINGVVLNALNQNSNWTSAVKNTFINHLENVTMSRSMEDGFLHIDLNASINDKGIFNAFQSVSYRRWGGKSGKDQLTGGSSIVKALRRSTQVYPKLKKNVFDALNLENLVAEFMNSLYDDLDIDEVEAGNLEADESEFEDEEKQKEFVTHKGNSRENRTETTKEEKLKEIKKLFDPELFIINVIPSTKKGIESYKVSVTPRRTVADNTQKVNFTEKQIDDLKQIKENLTSKDYVVVNEKLENKRNYRMHLGMHQYAYLNTQEISFTLRDNLKKIVLKEQDKQQDASNKLLNSFQRFASVILTEPYLYCTSEEEIKAEMDKIKTQLGGFDYFPCFYNSLEISFSDKNQFITADEYKGTWQGDEALQLGLAEIATLGVGVATGATITAATLGIGLLIFAAFYVASLGLSADSEIQLKRVRGGIRDALNNGTYKKLLNYYRKNYLRNSLGIFQDHKIYGDDQSAIEDFLQAIGNQDEIQPAITDFIKDVYTNLSVFKEFSKFADKLSSTSSAKQMINKSVQEVLRENPDNIKDINKYKQLAISNEITVSAIKDYMEFLWMFPANYDDRSFMIDAVEEDATDIYSLNDGMILGDYDNGVKVTYELEYTDSEDFFYFKEGEKFRSESLTDFDYFPYLITEQLKQNNDGIYSFFKKNRNKIKQEQNVKIAFLKNILTEILKENMILNRDILEEAGETKLLDAIDEVNIFELMETNAYPDIELPPDPRDLRSNKAIGPAYYFFEPAELMKDAATEFVGNEAAARKKIFDSSIEFVQNRRKGIYSGSKDSLANTGEVTKKTLNNFFDRTQLLRSISEAPIATDKEESPVAAITLGLPEVKSDNKPSSPARINPKATPKQAGSGGKQLKAYLQGLIKANKEKLASIQSMFGSGLGYKGAPYDLQSKIENLVTESRSDSFDLSKGARTAGVSNTSAFTKESVLGLSEDSNKSMLRMRSMKRAFPTFRLYLIEEDSVYSDKLYAFDDFFYYNSVIGFNFHNSRELSASVATIQLQNISGILDGSKRSALRDIDLDPNAPEESFPQEGNFIDSIVLRPGIVVQLRAGYESNTNDLEILLSGTITEINYAQENTICNITVQSFEVELEKIRKGNVAEPDETNEFYSTHQLLGSLMMSEELKHFGRHKVGAVFQTGENQDISLDLEDYKSSVVFSLPYTRSLIDTFKENTIMISLGATVVLGATLPLLKYGLGKTKIGQIAVESLETVFTKIPGYTRLTTYLPASKFYNRIPFFKSGSINQRIINAARATAPSAQRGSINTIDDAINFIIKYGNQNILPGVASNPLRRAKTQILLKNLNNGLTGMHQSFLEKGPVLGAISGVINKILRRGPKQLDEAFLRTVIRRERGLGALAIDGFYSGGVGTTLGLSGNVLMNSLNGLGFTYLLALGGAGIAIGGALGLVADLVVEGGGAIIDSFADSFREDREKLGKKYLMSPQDDNIFAPNPRLYIKNLNEGIISDDIGDFLLDSVGDVFKTAIFGTVSFNDWDKIGEDLKVINMVDKRLNVNKGDNRYILEGQTIWDVMKECTLRHPGYIYGSRPYKGTIEYRAFFGLPHQRYFSKAISFGETRKLNQIYELLIKTKSSEVEVGNVFKQTFPNVYARYNKFIEKGSKKDFYLNYCYNYWIKKTSDRFVPFRQHHFVSSKYDLIANNVITSSHNVINSVTVNYVQSAESSSTTAYSENKNIVSFRMRANNNIGPHNQRERTISHRNCINEANAFRYGVGELLYGARKMYEGSLTTIGNPHIQPWDIIVLNDNVTDMHGPLEVCSVTHMFSHQTGFITDIEVNAVVTSNEDVTHPIMSQSILYEARREIFEEYTSYDMLGTTRTERKRNIKEIIKDKIDEIIEERNNTTYGIDIITGDEDVDIESFSTQLTDKLYEQIENGGVGFLKDVTASNAKLPSELEDIFNQGASGLSVLSGGVVAYEATRSLLKSRAGIILNAGVGLKNPTGLLSYLKVPKTAVGFFAAGVLANQFSGSIMNMLSDSYSSGSLGKNMFRSFIMSRVDDANVIEVYPLVKDGVPLLSGGFEEVDRSEVWNNTLGQIFNQASDGMYSYLERKRELNSLGKKALQAYNEGELNSFGSFVRINTARFASVLNLGNKEEIIGYFYDN